MSAPPARPAGPWWPLLGLLLVSGCASSSGAPGPTSGTAPAPSIAAPPGPTTAAAALEVYLDCWRTKDLAAYDALLHSGFLFLPAEESPDDEFWRREQEMKMAQNAFLAGTPGHDYTAVVRSERPSTMVPRATAIEAELTWRATDPDTGTTGEARTKTLIFHFVPVDSGLWQLRAMEEPRPAVPTSDNSDPVLE